MQRQVGTTDITAGAATFDLVDTTDLEVGDQIGLLNDTLDLDWYIVMDVSGTTVTPSRVVDNDVNANAVVYTYRYLFNDALTVAYAAGTTLDVGDTTLYTVADQILVQLDSGAFDQREVASIDQGANQIDVTSALSGAAAIGNNIVNLTTRRDRFKKIKRVHNDQVRRRQSTDYEIPIVFQSRKDYFDLPNKNQRGTPIQAYYDRQLAGRIGGVWYLWNVPSDGREVINFTYERAIEIMVNPTDTFDVPEDWYDAITYNLAKRLIPKVGCSQERKADIVAGAQEYLDNALAFDSAVYGVRLKPQKYG